jgi:menaquinone-dependent protoporphyrinogen oxidase
MQDKILVTYSSRSGYTAGVATVIGKTLAEHGRQTDVRAMQDVTDLSQYKAVVGGSPIQAGNWLPEAIEFMQKNKGSLINKPFAAFTVCMTLAMPNGEKYRHAVADWTQPVRAIVKPLFEGYFAGALDISKIPSFSDRLKFRISVAFGVWKEGDHRDWNAIRIWTENLNSLLS